MVFAAGVFALRRKRQEEVLAAFESLFLEARQHDLAGCAGIGAGFQYDKLAGADGFGDVVTGVFDECHVRFEVFAQWRGDAHDDRVSFFEAGHIGGRVEATGRLHLRHHVSPQMLEIILAFVQRLNLTRVYIEANDGEAGFVKRAQQRQPDIPQADHADHGRFVCDFLLQRHQYSLPWFHFAVDFCADGIHHRLRTHVN